VDCDSKFFSLDKHKNHIIQHQAAKWAEDEAKARVAYGLYKKRKRDRKSANGNPEQSTARHLPVPRLW
jgi:hypothetical protein